VNKQGMKLTKKAGEYEFPGKAEKLKNLEDHIAWIAKQKGLSKKLADDLVNRFRR
jgi:hypothetical protein